MILPGERQFFRRSSTLVNVIKSHTKAEFESQLTNPILRKLWEAPFVGSKEDTLNATNTLPIILRSRKAVSHDVAKLNPSYTGLSLKIKQYTEYFKSIIKFYRVGVQNVWKNRRLMKEIKNKYFIETVTTGGRIIKRKLQNGQDLVNVLGALESLERTEQEALKKCNQSLLLNITRKEYQTILRTERDFYKLPLFALIVVIFAEMTPAICYLIPELAPSTCVFPGLISKANKHSVKAQKSLAQLRKDRYGDVLQKGEYPVQSIEKLHQDELQLIVESLNLKSRYLPIAVYPTTILKRRLSNKFQEIKVDNYYLVHGEENLWNLNKSELIRCCIDRGLINFDKDDLSHIGAHELRMRLFFFLGVFENEKSPVNVALLGLNHLDLDTSVFFSSIQAKDAHIIHGWWSQNHKDDLKAAETR